MGTLMGGEHAQHACRVEPGAGCATHGPAVGGGCPRRGIAGCPPASPTAPGGSAGLVVAGSASSECVGGHHTGRRRAGGHGRLVSFLAGCGHTGGHGWRVHEPCVRPPTERQVGEIWRKRPVTSQQQTTADAALRRQLARERFSIPSGTPAQAPDPLPDESSGQPGWLLASLGLLAAALALVAGLAVLAAKRASRRVRPGPAA
jgi:hypothetical protein